MDKERFEELLDNANLTQKEFATMAGIEATSVSRWKKTGKYPEWIEGYLKGKVAMDVIEQMKDLVNKID